MSSVNDQLVARCFIFHCYNKSITLKYYTLLNARDTIQRLISFLYFIYQTQI